MLGGARMADFVLRALEAVCTETIIAANDPSASEWFPRHRVVRDAEPGRGALGALETALCAATAGTVIICAWDLPFITASLLEELATVVDGGASCCVPQHPDGQLEPLCAAYNASAAPAATALLASGARAAHELVATLGGARWMIPVEAPDHAGPSAFHNINSHDDLARAVEWSFLLQSSS